MIGWRHVQVRLDAFVKTRELQLVTENRTEVVQLSCPEFKDSRGLISLNGSRNTGSGVPACVA